jgi:hypothetical protein
VPTQFPELLHVSLLVHALESLHAVPVRAVYTHPVDTLHESLVHALLSLHVIAVPAHAPPEHTSPLVHALESLHASVLFVYTHPVETAHVSVVHTLVSLHVIAVPAHPPELVHTSPLVHALESLQAVPVSGVYTQPVDVLHVSPVHPLLSLHVMVVPTQFPELLHVSPLVHALESLHAVPVRAVNTHPVDTLHESLVHTLLSLQVIAVPAHVPPEHTSPLVHALESLQALVLFVYTHPVDVLHESFVHTLLSLHVSVAPTQFPELLQTSGVVHAFPSVHAVPVRGVYTQPVDVAQESPVHELLSLHVIAVPAHVPPVQTSGLVHAFESLHGIVLLANTQS